MTKEMEGNFNHSKPVDYHGEKVGNEKEAEKLASELKTPENMKKWIGDKLTANEDDLRNLSDYGVKQLDEGFLLKMKKLENKENFLRRKKIIRTYSPKFISSFIKQYYEEIKKMNKTYQIPSFILNYLSIEQL